MTTKLKETYLFEHKGINIYIRLDYQHNLISLVEPDNSDNHPVIDYRKKKWLFADRGVDFLGSWIDILEAMQLAVKDAKQKYLDYKSEQDQIEEMEVIKMMNLADKKLKKKK